jgi:hypothetical protein
MLRRLLTWLSNSDATQRTASVPLIPFADGASAPRAISHDSEFSQYVTMFSAVSTRVRYSVIVLLLTSIMAISGYCASKQEGWTNARVRVARAALKHQVWTIKSDQRPTFDWWDSFTAEVKTLWTDPPEPDLDSEAAKQDAAVWARHQGIYDAATATRELLWLEKSQVDDVHSVRVPVLGIVFDINFIGAFVGITLVALMGVMLASLSRQHEILFLCLWKVRELACDEFGEDKKKWKDREERELQGSSANVLYHALAASQLFLDPPTLARWQPGVIARQLPLLFGVPALLEFSLFYSDVRTRGVGAIYSAEYTSMELAIEAVSVFVLALLAWACWRYSRAAMRKFRLRFFEINPQLCGGDQPSWRRWTQT